MRPEEWATIAPRITDVWGKTMARGTVEAWYLEIQGHDAGDVRAALVSLSRTEDRAPSLARLIAASRKARSDRFRDAPMLPSDPNALPANVTALVYSENYQPIAVEGGGTLPKDIRITRVDGRLPEYMWPQRAEAVEQPAEVPA